MCRLWQTSEFPSMSKMSPTQHPRLILLWPRLFQAELGKTPPPPRTWLWRNRIHIKLCINNIRLMIRLSMQRDSSILEVWGLVIPRCRWEGDPFRRILCCRIMQRPELHTRNERFDFHIKSMFLRRPRSMAWGKCARYCSLRRNTFING